MSTSVVIHSEGDDPHAIAVAEHLRCVGTDVLILAREKCFEDWNISLGGDGVIVETRGKRLTCADIRSVFWRRNYLAEAGWVRGDHLPAAVRSFLAEQRLLHVDGAFKGLALSVPFVNDVTANFRARSKPLQLALAKRHGFNVPRTYVGNNRDSALLFAESLWSQGRQCCTKNIESNFFRKDGHVYGRFTTLFDKSHSDCLDGLASCPMIFQEFVRKRYEYRVTVVGKDVFACRIDSQVGGGDTSIDWRNYNIPATPHSVTELPARMRDALISLVKSLGLVFAAVDLIEDVSGEYVLHTLPDRRSLCRQDARNTSPIAR